MLKLKAAIFYPYILGVKSADSALYSTSNLKEKRHSFMLFPPFILTKCRKVLNVENWCERDISKVAHFFDNMLT